MKILLDECLPLDLRHCFQGHEAHTVQWAGFKGLRNGDLLRRAGAEGYEILLTVDTGVPQQTYLVGRKLSVILIRSQTNRMDDLLPFVDAISSTLKTVQPGQVVAIL